ncbi:signal transduction histidine kinase [Catalinimonas alkaloidigena]|uniref:sensor histidine kinase n=1 Tax=Catalinimonas alkaloidigena TaxID=1075417 RepID=UPI0024067FCA|nr:HAMP domain-containing sensor histidine kinase [Catalinimonas alkaloidigena]MDF9796170.1 signal transduction histidine kinase [Catalinimonas alkaloidigena]
MIKSAETNEEILVQIGRDLKGMLARIRSCNYTLYKNFEKDLDEDSRKFFQTIERDCDSIKSIIHNMISVDSCFDDDYEQAPKTVVLNHIIKKIVDEFPAQTFKEKNIKIVYEDLDEEIYIYIDEQAITKVLEQLLTNACKFSYTDGQVVVKLVKYANVANISVSDQGIGIPKKLRPYIFNKFSKATRRGTMGEESSGLGLYLAKNIIERHQGSIWYESQEDNGSNFFINLPLRDRI